VVSKKFLKKENGEIRVFKKVGTFGALNLYFAGEFMIKGPQLSHPPQERWSRLFDWSLGVAIYFRKIGFHPHT